MPLKALKDGEEVQSWRYSREEWRALNAAYKWGEVNITTCCCGSPVILRAGSRIQHFAHKQLPEGCNWKEESPEHEMAKYIIYQACLEAGYEARMEIAGPGYEADVLATKDGEKVAFEVQLSRQTLDFTLERRRKFKESGVKDIWLFSRLPAGRKKRTPRMYPLTIVDDLFAVNYKGRDKPLEKFVKQILRPIETSQRLIVQPEEVFQEPEPWWVFPVALVLFIAVPIMINWFSRPNRPVQGRIANRSRTHWPRR